MPGWMKVTEKMLQKIDSWQFNLDVFFLKPILRYNLAFVFQGTVGRRNTKLRNESVISLYIWVAELRSLLLSPGVLLSCYLKLRSLRSYLCSAFLSITNLINKIANKNRIINTKFSRRTWQNNACQLLLCTQYMLPDFHTVVWIVRAVVWAFCSTVLDNNYNEGVSTRSTA